MTKPSDLREQLAAIEHERWADWQRWVHLACTENPDGSLTIPAALVARWKRQIDTPYEHLTELEKDSDRAQVDRYWHLLEAALTPRDEPESTLDVGHVSAAALESIAGATGVQSRDVFFVELEDEAADVDTEWAVAAGGYRPGIDGTLSQADSEQEARDWLAEALEVDPSSRLMCRTVTTGPWTPPEQT